MKFKIIASLALVFAATFFQTSSALACSCPSPSLQESVKNSTAIFSGKVISVDRKTFMVKFQVYRQWKGVSAKTVTVFPGPGSCSYQFWKGREFLVYARGQKQLSTSLCTRTKKMSDAQEDLAALNKLTKANQ